MFEEELRKILTRQSLIRVTIRARTKEGDKPEEVDIVPWTSWGLDASDATIRAIVEAHERDKAADKVYVLYGVDEVKHYDLVGQKKSDEGTDVELAEVQKQGAKAWAGKSATEWVEEIRGNDER